MTQETSKITARHTAGPWMYPGTGNFIGGADRQRVADVYRDNLGADERQANAHLIAAAPELLAALEAVMVCYADLLSEHNHVLDNEFNSSIEEHESLKTARAAINKAKGG